MKLRKLFLAVLAGATMLMACDKKEVDLGPAKLTVNPTDVSFEAEVSSQDISLVATRDWAVTALPDWVALSKEAGSANPDVQKLSISVTENKGYNRSATIVFSIGFARQALTISQVGPDGEIDNGDGSKANPFNVEGVIAYVTELGQAESDKNVYVKGKISSISEEFTTQYGNGNFTISEDGTTDGAQFTAYRVLYLGNKKFASGDTQIKMGDDVILYGKVVNYNGKTPETVQGSAFLFSLNGVDKGGDDSGQGGEGTPKGTGTLEDPYNPAGIAVVAAALADNAVSTESYYMKGKISKIAVSKNVDQTFANSGDYGNASFYITDSEDATGEFYIYQTYYLGNRKWITGDTDIKVGDEVIVYGPVTKYVSSYGTTLETSGKGASYIYSLNGTTDGGGQGGGTGTPSGTGVKDDPYNVAAAVAAVKDLTWTSNTDFQKVGPFYVKGKVSSVKFAFDAEHGTATFNISDDGTTTAAQFACYSVKYYDGAAWVEGNTQVTVGADVVIYGELQNYKGNTPETVTGSYVVSISGGSDVPPVSHDGLTPETAFTASEANAWIMANLEDKASTETKYYVKGKIQRFYVKDNADQNFTNNSYHQASFFITDDGTENKEKEFEAYQIDYLNDATFDPAKDTDVKVGDEVVIYGALKRWGTTAETTEKGSAYLYSVNAGGEVPPTPGPGGDEVTVKLTNESTWTAGTDGTYGAGFEMTASNGVKIGIYKHESTTAIVTPDQNAAKVYKKAVIVLTAPAGKSISSLRFKASNYSSGQYCVNLTYVEGGTGVMEADMSTFVIGSLAAPATKVVLQALDAQVRLVEATMSLSGEGGDTPGGDTPGGDTPAKPVNEGTLESPFTVADALIAAKDADLTGKEYYVKAVVGKDIAIKNGVASFELMDGTTDGKLTVVKAKSFKGAAFDGSEPLDWLDEVILKGTVTEYSTLPALTEGELVLWNGKKTFKNPEKDLSKIIALAKNADAYFEGLVSAVTTKSFVVTDGTNNVYVYQPAAMAAIGDKVTVMGTAGSYSGLFQINKSAEVEVISSGNTVTYPDATDITAGFDTYAATVNAFVKVLVSVTVTEGKVTVAVEGATTALQVTDAPEALGLAALDGKKAYITGYYGGSYTNTKNNTTTKYIFATKAEEYTQGGGGEQKEPFEIVFASNSDVTSNGVTISCKKGTGSSAPAWNSGAGELRLYVGNTITATSESNIAKIEYYFHKQGSKAWQSVSMTSTEGTYTDCEASTSTTDSKVATWTGSSKSIVLTLGNVSGGQRVLEKVVVTLE